MVQRLEMVSSEPGECEEGSVWEENYTTRGYSALYIFLHPLNEQKGRKCFSTSLPH